VSEKSQRGPPSRSGPPGDSDKHSLDALEVRIAIPTIRLAAITLSHSVIAQNKPDQCFGC
jgi:hypothetical protein